MRRLLLLSLVVGTGVVVVAGLATSQHSAGQDPAGASRTQPQPPDGVWKLEAIVLKDGKEYRGLLEARSERQIDFAEIVQRPGKRTYAIVRGIEPAQVARVSLLPKADHQALVGRFRQLRYWAVIEAGRMEEVRLRTVTRGGKSVLIYDADWFTLVSTADEESTRRCVVRIEQIFRAFRTLLPPRVEMPRRVEITLYASLDEFRQELKSLDFDLGTPAFYVPQQSRIVAASELSEYARRLKHVRGEAQALTREYEAMEQGFDDRLSELSDELKRAGFGRREITAELSLRKSVFKKEKEELLARVTEQMRQNEARFADVTGAMFRRLYHEALHAYLDNVVYPSDEFHVPRWLHEGLAQVFESGQLEGDSLRLDAADPLQLARLQADLRSGDRLRLAELLTAEGAAYSGRHDAVTRRRHYLYAWGVAHHLVFRENLLAGGALDRYVADKRQDELPVEHFERLVARPLEKWETDWRAAMLELSPPAR